MLFNTRKGAKLEVNASTRAPLLTWMCLYLLAMWMCNAFNFILNQHVALCAILRNYLRTLFCKKYHTPLISFMHSQKVFSNNDITTKIMFFKPTPQHITKIVHCQYTIGSSMSFYPDFILIFWKLTLSKFYPDFILIFENIWIKSG